MAVAVKVFRVFRLLMKKFKRVTWLSIFGLLLHVQCIFTSAQASETNSSYFPLKVGNQWRYQCAVEGSDLSEKFVRITKSIRKNGVLFFKVEEKTKDSGEPLTFYYFESDDGIIRRNIVAQVSGAEIVVPNQPEADASKKMTYWTKKQSVSTPAIKNAQALLIANFDFEDPQLTESKRSEWQGTYYVKGIGQIKEADGTGAGCSLTSYSVK